MVESRGGATGHRPHAPHGTNKNIFAYRMICKDTVEDKILQLQEKKRLLADLITDDSGFVKSLTREDIEYLFS